MVTDEMVKAAEEAVYPRHERGFLMKPLVGAIDMRAALEAALRAAVPEGEPVAMGVFRNGEMIGFVCLGEEFKLPEDTDERRPLYTRPDRPDMERELAEARAAHAEAVTMAATAHRDAVAFKAERDALAADNARLEEDITRKDEALEHARHLMWTYGFSENNLQPIRLALSGASIPAPADKEAFQARVRPWMLTCFGAEISGDRVERADRLLEEVFELLQSGGYDPARVVSLRDYVWGRDVGEPHQEVGGVMVTLAAYCLAHDLDMHDAGETELARIWTKVEKIRAKQAAKPKHSPLPVHIPAPDKAEARREALEEAAKVMLEALHSAEIKLARYMCIHGPNSAEPLRGTYSGGLSAEYEASLNTIRAAIAKATLISQEQPK